MDGVSEDSSPRGSHLKNRDLSSLSLTVGGFLSQYGWHLLAVTLVVYFLIQHLQKRRSSQSHHTPPPQTQVAEIVARRQEAMEAARKKMQEELDVKAAIFKERQKQQEEEKRRQKIETWESMQQGKSCKENPKHYHTSEDAGSSAAAQKPKTDKKPLRSVDYSPLSGQGGGSCSWRPGRRGPSSGG